MGLFRIFFGNRTATGGAVPFDQTDWPNPRLPARVLAESRGTNPNLFVPPPKPFQKLDWPNPRMPARIVAESEGTNPNLFPPPAVGTVPVVPLAWPNPRAPYRVDAAGTGTNPNLFPPPPKPFLLSDWPNPRPARALPADQQSTNPNLFPPPAVAAAPFMPPPMPVPAPAGRVRGLESVGVNPNLFPPPPVPFNLEDWPIPAGARASPRGFHAGPPLALTASGPVAPIAWPNPARRTPPANEFAAPNLIIRVPVVVAGAPFIPVEWANPRRTLNRAAYAALAPMVPFVVSICIPPVPAAGRSASTLPSDRASPVQPSGRTPAVPPVC